MAKVMRKTVGDQLEVVAEQALYLGEIVDDDKKSMRVRLVKQMQDHAEPRTKITLFQGLPKGSKMETIIQKSVEIGATSIVPVEMRRVVKKGVSLERWNRVAKEACKQCKRIHVPEVETAISIEQIDPAAFDLFLVCYEEEESVGIKQALEGNGEVKTVGVLIGPEGGIDKSEVVLLKDKGAITVTLGARILRTETAGLAASSVILYQMGDMEA